MSASWNSFFSLGYLILSMLNLTNAFDTGIGPYDLSPLNPSNFIFTKCLVALGAIYCGILTFGLSL